MVFWTGRGWVVPVIGFALIWAAEVTVEFVTGDSAYYQRNFWPMATAVMALAVVLFVLVDRWESGCGERDQAEAPATPAPGLISPASGPIRFPLPTRSRRGRRARGVRAPSSGAFWFIRLRWWRWIALAVGGAMYGAQVLGFSPT